MFDSGLLKDMWGEAVYTAIYLLNRCSSNNVENTPIEEWNKKKLKYTNLQIFGCVASTKILKPLKKLDPRAKEYL